MMQLEDTVQILKTDLSPDIYSPIRDKYPDGVNMQLREIISYTISLSDNNGCDILISLRGGVDDISEYLKTKGIEDVKIANYERELQSDWNLQFENWTTPKAMVELLKHLHNNQLLTPKSTDFIWDVMTESSTGSIGNLLPQDIQIGYKTGFSGVGADGQIAAQHCVGMMKQEGRDIAFAIFITDSKESKEVNLDIIARIGELIYKTYYK